jgi:hypothetical protein
MPYSPVNNYYISLRNLNFVSEVTRIFRVRFEVFTAVTMKNCVFWNVTPCDFVRTDVSEELSASNIRVTRIGELGITLGISSQLASVASYT